MAYMKDGVLRHTLKEKIAYHTECANTGVNKSTGEKLSTTQRVRHANRATKCVNKLNRFMNTGARFADMKKQRSNQNKQSSSKTRKQSSNF